MNHPAADLMERAGQGDQNALARLFTQHRPRLQRMVKLRMDRRLQGRFDASDVLQEAYLELSRSLADYLQNPNVSFFIWLRMITSRKLLALHRRHLGAQARAAGREVSIDAAQAPPASSVALAAQLLGHHTTPSQAAVRAELKARMQESLECMPALDREILALRHYEQLNNTETAQVLGLSETAASNRYVRALKRLKKALIEGPANPASHHGQ